MVLGGVWTQQDAPNVGLNWVCLEMRAEGKCGWRRLETQLGG